MKRILLFLLIMSFIPKKGVICFIPIQSLFFVLALRQKPLPFGIIKGIILLIFGLILSIISLLNSVNGLSNFTYYCLISAVVFLVYLCFFGLLLLFRQSKNSDKNLNTVSMLCAVIPCFAIVPEKIPMPYSLPATLMLIDSILIYINYILMCKRTSSHDNKSQ